MKHIVAFAGSNNPRSINHQLVLAATKKLPTQAVHLLTLTDFTAPIYSEGIEQHIGIPYAMKRLHHIFLEADGFIVASPEHNGLLPAFFKNTIDWLSRIDQQFFGHKPVFLMSTSPGKYGGSNNLRILMDLMPRWGADVVSHFSLSYFDSKFDLSSQTIVDTVEEEKLTRAIEKFSQEVFEAYSLKHNNKQLI